MIMSIMLLLTTITINTILRDVIFLMITVITVITIDAHLVTARRSWSRGRRSLGTCTKTAPTGKTSGGPLR